MIYLGPTDFALVNADDALLDNLGGPTPEVVDKLDELLVAWRDDIDSPPNADLIHVGLPRFVKDWLYGRCA